MTPKDYAGKEIPELVFDIINDPELIKIEDKTLHLLLNDVINALAEDLVGGNYEASDLALPAYEALDLYYEDLQNIVDDEVEEEEEEEEDIIVDDSDEVEEEL